MKRSALRRRVPLRSVGRRRAREQAAIARAAELCVRRAGWRCERCHVLDDTVEAHHVYQRATHPHLVADVRAMRAVCRSCHQYVHRNVAWSLANGWLAASWEEPV